MLTGEIILEKRISLDSRSKVSKNDKMPDYLHFYNRMD